MCLDLQRSYANRKVDDFSVQSTDNSGGLVTLAYSPAAGTTFDAGICETFVLF